jgi:hypothetical protein
MSPPPLMYNEVLRIDYISITDWVCIADGSEFDIGIFLDVGRSDVSIAYTPTVDDDPDSVISDVYFAGNIFMTTESQVVWVKPVNPNFPASITAEIIYNIPGAAMQPIGVGARFTKFLTLG